jgi:hypothetical protein
MKTFTFKKVAILSALCLTTLLFNCKKDTETYKSKTSAKDTEVSPILSGVSGNALATPDAAPSEKTEAGDGNDYLGNP